MKQALFLINFAEQYTRGYTQAEALRFAAEAGFAGVEATNLAELSTPDLKKAEALAATAAELGLAIPCMSMGARLECENWRERVRLLKEYVDVARALGAPLFHHTLAPTLGMLPEEMPFYRDVRAQLIEAAADVQQYARAFGITCVYEDQGFVVNGVHDYEDFYDSLPLDNKGVVADLGNIYFYGEQPARFTAHFLHKIRHVHVKDYLLKPGGGQFPGRGWYLSKQGDFIRGTVLGHGATDFVPIFRTLIRGGYDMWYSLEFDGMEDPFRAAVLGRENMQYYFAEAARQLGHSDVVRIGD
ncbi:MAG: sugar phosphate isomerase/epimerase [Clostridiales bacterium]|nr:sugar phosphate isomerase/epimerase [Clostridiales bacterium]